MSDKTEICKICGEPAVEDGLCNKEECYNKMLEFTGDWDEYEGVVQ